MSVARRRKECFDRQRRHLQWNQRGARGRCGVRHGVAGLRVWLSITGKNFSGRAVGADVGSLATERHSASQSPAEPTDALEASRDGCNLQRWSPPLCGNIINDRIIMILINLSQPPALENTPAGDRRSGKLYFNRQYVVTTSSAGEHPCGS